MVPQFDDFSVAQAFTPGNERAVSCKAPLMGLSSAACFSPRRKRLGYRKSYDEISRYRLIWFVFTLAKDSQTGQSAL